MGQWLRWRIRDKRALLGHWRGRDAECGFCAPWARAEGPGGARGPGCPLAAEPGAGRGCRPHLAERTRSGGRARRRGAGREHGPGLAEQGALVGTPRRLVSARAARPGPSHQAHAPGGDRYVLGCTPPHRPNLPIASQTGLSDPEWFRSALNYSFRPVAGLGPGRARVGPHSVLGFIPGYSFPGFPQSVHRGWVGLEWGWSWKSIND